MTSKVLADARRFLSEDGVTASTPAVLPPTLLPMSSPVSVASSAASSSWSTPVSADEANQQFIISILDDNLHGAYEQELFDLRSGRFTGALSLDRLLNDDAGDGATSNGSYSNGRPIARRPSNSATATPSRAATVGRASTANRPSLSRTVAEASIGRSGRVGPSPYARPSSAGGATSNQARRSSNIGVAATPARSSVANGANRRSTLSPRAIGGGSVSSSSKCVLPAAYETDAELKRDFDAVMPDLANDRSSSWEKQTAALDALTHMLNATESDVMFASVLGSPLLVRALVELLKSPRSALVRHATSVATKLTERLVLDQRWRRREAPDILGALQQTLASRTNVISECAHEALVVLAHALPGAVLLPAVRSMCANARDARLRRTGAELLAILLERNGGNDVDQAEASTVQALVIALLTDADPEARRNARACFVAFCEVFPELAPEVDALLDPEARRAIERGGLTTPRRQSPASTVVSPSQSASRLRQPTASARPSTTPRRLSTPSTSTSPVSAAASSARTATSAASSTSRIKPPTVFARPTATAAAPATAPKSEARSKPNIRRPVTRKLFLGNDATGDDDFAGDDDDVDVDDVDVETIELPVGRAPAASNTAVTPPQRSRSNSLEWFDSLTSSPAVKKPEGLLSDDGIGVVSDFAHDDEALLRAAAAQLLAEEAPSVPAPTAAAEPPHAALVVGEQPKELEVEEEKKPITETDDNDEGPNEW